MDLPASEIQVMVLATMTVVNIIIAQGRLTRTSARETRRLQVALATELSELLSLQTDNLKRLEEGKNFLLSSRACMTVYRGNLGRLIVTPDAALGPLVSAYAQTERLEHFIAATAKANGAMSYKLIDNETPVTELIERFQSTVTAVETAIRAMELSTGNPRGRPRSSEV